jgi:hypothetical protein
MFAENSPRTEHTIKLAQSQAITELIETQLRQLLYLPYLLLYDYE